MESTPYLVPTTPELAERSEVDYVCPAGHIFTKVFSAQAEIPDEWDCPQCGRIATRSTEQSDESATSPQAEPTERARTHWDMLLERRSIPELDALLKQRVEEIHALNDEGPSSPTR